MKFQWPVATEVEIAAAAMAQPAPIKATSRQPNGDGRAQVLVG